MRTSARDRSLQHETKKKSSCAPKERVTEYRYSRQDAEERTSVTRHPTEQTTASHDQLSGTLPHKTLTNVRTYTASEEGTPCSSINTLHNRPTAAVHIREHVTVTENAREQATVTEHNEKQATTTEHTGERIIRAIHDISRPQSLCMLWSTSREVSTFEGHPSVSEHAREHTAVIKHATADERERESQGVESGSLSGRLLRPSLKSRPEFLQENVPIYLSHKVVSTPYYSQDKKHLRVPTQVSYHNIFAFMIIHNPIKEKNYIC